MNSSEIPSMLSINVYQKIFNSNLQGKQKQKCWSDFGVHKHILYAPFLHGSIQLGQNLIFYLFIFFLALLSTTTFLKYSLFSLTRPIH